MKIEVRDSPVHGRGVFAIKKIRKNEVIEDCPTIVLPRKDIQCVNKTALANYYFQWSGGKAAIALGCGSLYNHSYTPNAKYCEYDDQVLRFKARRKIEPGEEITVNYNGDPKCKFKVWFDR